MDELTWRATPAAAPLRAPLRHATPPPRRATIYRRHVEDIFTKTASAALPAPWRAAAGFTNRGASQRHATPRSRHAISARKE